MAGAGPVRRETHGADGPPGGAAGCERAEKAAAREASEGGGGRGRSEGRPLVTPPALSLPGDVRSVPRRKACGQSAIGRYTLLPAAANSFDFWAMPCSISAWLPPCSRRMSCEIFMLQNFGPHIEQK